MTPPNTAREALVVEVLGDVARLLDRAAALTAAMDDARRDATRAHDDLSALLVAFERRVAMITENAKTRALEHVASRVDEVARQSAQRHQHAMSDAARDVFKVEIEQPLMRLIQALRHSAKHGDRSWVRWLTHLATALISSAAAWAIVTHIKAQW